LRKLQSTLRNNVNTNFGKRADLAKFLAANGAPRLMEKLAGQALNAWMPRGLGSLGMQLGLEGAAGLFGHAAGAGLAGAGLGVLATMPFMSPRLMGEASYYAGKASTLPLQSAARGAFQAGRLNEPLRLTVHPMRTSGNPYLNNP
jgi:hypothetical protein